MIKNAMGFELREGGKVMPVRITRDLTDIMQKMEEQLTEVSNTL